MAALSAIRREDFAPPPRMARGVLSSQQRRDWRKFDTLSRTDLFARRRSAIEASSHRRLPSL